MKGRKYTSPTAKGDLLEAEACKSVQKDLLRLCEKYQKKVAREQAARDRDLEAAMGYTSEDAIREDYGWGFITEKQYDLFRDLFQKGAAALDNRLPTTAERAMKILNRIAAEIREEQLEWEFCALSPAEQSVELERAAQARREWTERIAELKKKRGAIAALEE